MAVLVCGGAGYIGSHTVAALVERGEQVVVADNMTKGHAGALPFGGKLCVGDVRDSAFLDKVFAENDIDAVIDFAAHIEVGDSMKDPLAFYDNNVYSVVKLVGAMNRAGVKHIVFSSTAAVYGQPDEIPITESCAKDPTNAYGNSKLAVEQLLRWCDVAYGIKSTCLRYFNASGAHPSGLIGEAHEPETHLVPIVLQAALGQREAVTIFGDDYPTQDGTCVRDYIHVTDLADAHIKALERLRKGGATTAYNLGSGTGFSVKQIIEMAREVTGANIAARLGPRRAGDPAALVASSARIKEELGWEPGYDNVRAIIESAWNWHKSHPRGYSD